MNKTMIVSTIEMGTVIDHIPSRGSFKIVQLLSINKIEDRITIGVNLLSKKLGKKDLIKIENIQLTPERAKQVALFAPSASINLIKEYKVVKKYKNKLPSSISSILICPNSSCITNYEKIPTNFYIEETGEVTELYCKYCRKKFLKEEIQEFKR